MDPDAALAAIRDAIARYHIDLTSTQTDAGEAVELFIALDNWLSDGGFLPEAWQWDWSDVPKVWEQGQPDNEGEDNAGKPS